MAGIGSTVQANAASDLEPIETEQVGFQALASENKLRLLPTPWSPEKFPLTTASLLSIASGRGLLAAAGPDALVIATTESVRQAISTGSKDKTNANFTPQATIQVPRLSQVVFSSDESCLVISAEEGGGLAVYDTDGLLNGKSESAFQIPTNGVAVRQILANPSKENSHQFGLVLSNGQLLLADLKQRQLVNGASGSPVFKENVSCACWSRLGKQIVAGLADGTAVQLDLQGNTKAVIPKPPQVSANRDPQEQSLPVTAIYWLETFDFLMIHSPINPPADGDGMGPRNDAEYHLVHRDKTTGSCSYHQFMDPCPGFMDQRVPTHHFIQRLREFLPNLDDTLILSSTISTDIGMITRSSVPLSQDVAADQITHIYTTTTPLEDTRRAALPVSLEDGMSDTSVVGMALDLSSKSKVQKPIPSDEEIDESATPLPALFVLNHEGVLSAWHFVYNESIRQKKAYPGLTHQTAQQQTSAPASTTASAFGASAPAPAQTPSKPAFGQSSTPAFGSTSAFGGGKAASPWAAPPSATPKAPDTGKPAGGAQFGAPSAFGQTGGMGAQKASPWGSSTPSKIPQPSQPSTAFGGNASGQSPFASFAKPSTDDKTAASSPFGSFSKPGNDPKRPAPSPFGSFSKTSGDDKGSTSSPFGGFAKAGGDDKASASSPFGTFGKSSTEQSKPATQSSGSFGQPSTDANKTAVPAFGSVGKLGAAQGTKQPSAFGSNDNKPLGSPFSSFTGKPQNEDKNTSASPFSTAGSGPSAFSSFGTKPNNQASPFASTGQQKPGMPANDSFGSTVTLNSTTGSFSSGGAFGQGSSFGKTSFGQPSKAQDASKPSGDNSQSPGLGSFGGFKLGSTFKPDGTAKDDLPKPKNPGASLFGSGFANSLNTLGKTAEPTTPIKQEPGTEQSPNINDIPDASATSASPPKQTRKDSEGDYAPPGLLTPQGQLNEVSKQLPTSAQDDAPLPPDFINSKPKTADSPPATDDAPLPPDFLSSKPKAADEGADVPIAGSPPLDVGDERLSEPASEDEEEDGPPEEDEEPDWSDEEDQEEEDDEDEEGDDDDDEDDEDEEDDDEDDRTVENPEQLSAFEARVSPASPKRNTQNEQSTTPETDMKKASYTPAGFPMPKTTFAPPAAKPQQSPRSPSPVRGSSRPPAAQRPSFGRISVPPAKPVERPTSRQNAPTPQPPTEAELEDEEDARIKSILNASIQPSTELPEFVAHHNYTGVSDKPGVAGSVEKVFRDVNSMIDTLGLNARSLQAFVDGHSHARDDDSPMTRRDLEDEEGWVFAELDDLRTIIDGVGKDLENGRLDDPSGKIADCLDEEKELQKLKSRAADLRKQIATRTDPRQQAEHYNAPLPSESAAQQTELRQSVQRMQKQLAEAEEAMSILRADLASVPTDGQSKGASNVPTVEAVTNTILKMTAMVEQRSGDVDVLESQIRRLPKGLASLRLQDDYEDDLIGAMRGSKLLTASSGSPVSTPRAARNRMTARGDPLGMSGMFGSRYARTPPMSGRQSVADLGASALGRSTASFGASTRKKMADVSVEEAEGWLGKEKSRKKVLTGLKDIIERRGVREVKMKK
jgi:nucleoporin NUP159